MSLILLAFTAQGTYHTVKDYYIKLSQKDPTLDSMSQHPVFLIQIVLFALVIVGAYLVPLLPPHCKCGAKRGEINWSFVRKESDKNYAARQSMRETRL